MNYIKDEFAQLLIFRINFILKRLVTKFAFVVNLIKIRVYKLFN